MRKYLNIKSNMYYLYFFFSLLFLEGVMRIYLHIPGTPVFMVLFTIPAALFLGFLCHILPRVLGKVMAFFLTVFLDIIYIVQIVYYHIYGSFASVSQIGMSKDAMDTFGGAAMMGVKECLPAILFVLFPLIVLVILTVCKLPGARADIGWKYGIFAVLTFGVLHFGVVLLLPLGGSMAYSPEDTYKNTFVLDKSEQQFGVLVTLRMELKTMLLGRGQTQLSKPGISDAVVTVSAMEPETEESDMNSTEKASVSTDVSVPIQTPISYPEQIYDINFDELYLSTDNPELQQLDKYFSEVKPTTKNEYTGMFEGYNLIVICCESYSPYLISEEFTPTLYKMSHEGIVFNNFYNTICDNTSNSEYVLNMSLLPDVSLYSNGSGDVFNTFTLSKDNYFPFCYGNRLRELGYRSYAFHNFVGKYYKRNETHENMGYEFMYMSHGLEYDDNCPTSDVSLISQAEEYMYETDENGEITPFVSYFLTFSGHMPYLFSSAEHWFKGNDMAVKNQDAVQHFDYSEPAKAYLAAQVELEYAMEELILSLQRAGIADKTLVVLTGDHYPYSLGLEKLEEIAGHSLDPEYDKYKGSFILWTEGMEETIEVDTPCCTLDIMPTIYNLMGVDFDSRLLMGTDIFSEGPHAAILMDRSFITDCVKYDANTGEVEVAQGVTLPENYIDAWNTVIKDKYNVSKLILYNDYYRHLGLNDECLSEQ